MTKCPNISKGSKATGNPGMFVDLFHYILTNLKIIWVTCGLKKTKYLTEYNSLKTQRKVMRFWRIYLIEMNYV